MDGGEARLAPYDAEGRARPHGATDPNDNDPTGRQTGTTGTHRAGELQETDPHQQLTVQNQERSPGGPVRTL